jgi:hypothetical protein
MALSNQSQTSRPVCGMAKRNKMGEPQPFDSQDSGQSEKWKRQVTTKHFDIEFGCYHVAHTHIYIYIYIYIVLKYDVWYIVSTFANWDPSSFHFAIWIIHYLTLPAAAIKWVLGSTNLQCLHEIDPFPQRDSRVSHVLLPKPLEKKRTFCPQMDKRERRLTLENYKANQWSNWAIFCLIYWCQPNPWRDKLANHHCSGEKPCWGPQNGQHTSGNLS